MNTASRENPATRALAARTRQYASFRVADLLLAVEVVKVREVLRYQEMTMVPLASSAVEGLINLRGLIVVAIDLRRSLGLPRVDQRPMNIVLQTPDGVVSLLVDEVGDVIDVPLDRYAPVPDNMPAEQRALIECVYDLDDGLLLVLDTAQVLDRACH
jgi:purine-binding chemotaxis protein CheW